MDALPAKSIEEYQPDRILRECDCPPWVARCAHFGGRCVVLVEFARWLEPMPPALRKRQPVWDNDWAVIAGDEEPLLVNVRLLPCTRLSYNTGLFRWKQWVQNRAEAEAAFRQAEEELIRGEM